MSNEPKDKLPPARTAPPPPRDEVSISAGIDATGLHAKLKSRTIGALDAMGGNALDLQNSKLEGQVRIQRAKDDLSVRLLEAAGDAAVGQIRNDPEAASIVLEQFLGEHAQKLLRRKDVFVAAVEDLKQLPSPPESDGGPDIINPDWLNTFTQFVDRIDGEELKELFSRVLAGEIRKPGSFSLTSLRIVSEMDHEIAKTFERWACHRLQNGAIPREKQLQEADLKRGNFLQEIGLLSNVEPPLALRIVADENGIAVVRGESLALVVEMTAPGETVEITMSPLTRAGREVASLLTDPPDERAALKLAAEMIRSKVKSLRLGTIVGRRGESVDITQMEPI